MSAPASAQPGTPLTVREREVLAAVAEGCPNSEIAVRLHVSESTVKTHLQGAIARLGAKNRVNAVYLALKAGVIT